MTEYGKTVVKQFKKFVNYMLREGYAKSKREIALSFGNSRGHLTDIENYERCLNTAHIFALQKKYGVNPKFLLGYSEQMFLPKTVNSDPPLNQKL